jgi:thiazole synthase ThiGH ThiG subunit
MKKNAELLNEILNSHAFNSMCVKNSISDINYDAKIAVEVIQEAISKLEVISEENSWLQYDIRYIQHANKRIDEMINGYTEYCKEDLIIYHDFIEYTITKIIATDNVEKTVNVKSE